MQSILRVKYKTTTQNAVVAGGMMEKEAGIRSVAMQFT